MVLKRMDMIMHQMFPHGLNFLWKTFDAFPLCSQAMANNRLLFFFSQDFHIQEIKLFKSFLWR